jgi:hypothetical protein
MATTAKITLSSADLTSDSLALNITTTLKNAAGDNVTLSSGVQRVSIAAGTIDSSSLATARAYIKESTASATLNTNWFKNHLYIKNVTATTGQGTLMILSDGGDLNMGNASAGTCEATSCDHAIATLVKDDWMFIPWPAFTDLHIENKDASNAALVEFMIIG